MCLAQEPQRNNAGEAQTRAPLPLTHCAPSLRFVLLNKCKDQHFLCISP